MPVVKANFELKYDDMLELRERIINFGKDAENVINECLKNTVSPKVAKSITDFLPVSEKGKRHAKDNLWYELDYYNIAFVLSNSLKGKRGTSFYYLYYPATGTGQSYKRGPNDFMGNGVNKEYDNIVTDLLNSLNKKAKEDLE